MQLFLLSYKKLTKKQVAWQNSDTFINSLNISGYSYMELDNDSGFSTIHVDFWQV